MYNIQWTIKYEVCPKNKQTLANVAKYVYIYFLIVTLRTVYTKSGVQALR